MKSELPDKTAAFLTRSVILTDCKISRSKWALLLHIFSGHFESILDVTGDHTFISFTVHFFSIV